MLKSAVGSSYCIDQSPGGERVGGVTITLTRRRGSTGTMTAVPTERFIGKHLTDDEFRRLAAAAEQGVRDAARELEVDLDDFDVVLSEFAYHPVDSSPRIFYGAATSAFQSAWQAWGRYRAAIQRMES